MHRSPRLLVALGLVGAAAAASAAVASPLPGIGDSATVASRAFRLDPRPPVLVDADERAAREAFDVLNAERTERGLPVMFWQDALTSAAVGHSVDMAAMGELDHVGSDGSTPGDRLVAAGFVWNDWGESIALGYPTADAVITGWIDSPQHRKYLLGDYTHVGIGVAGSDDGVPYWTLIVGNERSQLIR